MRYRAIKTEGAPESSATLSIHVIHQLLLMEKA